MDANQKECLDLLIDEISFITLKWQIYTQLYGTSEETIDLFNEFVPICFGIFQRTLLEDIILSLCRLTDPSSQNKNINLSLKYFNKILIPNAEKEFINDIEVLTNKINLMGKKIRKYRHKIISHNDYISTKANFSNIERISRKEIKLLLAEIYKYINVIYNEFNNSDFVFGVINTGLDDAKYLINILEKHKRIEEKEYDM